MHEIKLTLLFLYQNVLLLQQTTRLCHHLLPWLLPEHTQERSLNLEACDGIEIYH